MTPATMKANMVLFATLAAELQLIRETLHLVVGGHMRVDAIAGAAALVERCGLLADDAAAALGATRTAEARGWLYSEAAAEALAVLRQAGGAA